MSVVQRTFKIVSSIESRNSNVTVHVIHLQGSFW